MNLFAKAMQNVMKKNSLLEGYKVGFEQLLEIMEEWARLMKEQQSEFSELMADRICRELLEEEPAPHVWKMGDCFTADGGLSRMIVSTVPVGRYITIAPGGQQCAYGTNIEIVMSQYSNPKPIDRKEFFNG